ncbi:MAG: amino acid adenylation domain-containing protein, partial [bacterium]|nr:amino acid adenylation domain-containing protein [bacterium]
TGDLARWLPDGIIEFLGRADTQVKVRGFRVELEEIENRLKHLDGIIDATVIARETGNGVSGDKSLCAYVVSGGGVKVSAVREELATHLPNFMVPSYFMELEKIPLTPNGKVNRKALPEPELITDEVYHAPRNETESKLLALWAEVLGRDRIHSSQLQTSIGINDNFFNLGGHSLKAIMLVSKIHKRFNLKLSLMEIFQSPTIKGLAAHLKHMESTGDKPYISIDPAEEKEYYRLSSAQQRLFILYRLDEAGIAYNMPLLLTLKGKIHRVQLENTFKRLVCRHEGFRTSFERINDEIFQRINKDVNFEVQYYGDVEDEKSYANITKSFVRPFDLFHAPLLRVGLIKRGEKRHILMLDMHHIISDGISIDVMIRDFTNLYRGEILPAPPLQYKDFSEWQNSRKEQIKAQESYWLETFAGEIPVLNLPTDFIRPPVQSFGGRYVHFRLTVEETVSLQRLAGEGNVTLFMALLAIYNVFLAKVSNMEEIVVGSPIAGRRHADLEPIIGMFVNTLMLKNHPGGDKIFSQFLQELSTSTLLAFENQDYQYEELVQAVEVKRDISRNSLFDTLFTLQNVEMTEVDIPGLTLKPYSYENNTAKFDLSLTTIESNQQLTFTFEYCIKLFKHETIQRFVNYFKKIVSSVLSNPAGKISRIDILPEEEKVKVLYNFNDTTAEYSKDKTVFRLFEEQVGINSDSIAVVGLGMGGTRSPEEGSVHSQVSYGQLNEKANQLARSLKEKGVGPGIIVAVMMERSISMLIGIFGILKAGGIYLPIDPNYPGERVKYMLEDSSARFLIGDAGSSATYHHLDFVLTHESNDENHRSSIVICQLFTESSLVTFPLPVEPVTSADLAYVIYTSGSTGKPKGVMIEHRAVANFIKGMTDIIDFGPGDSILSLTTVSFDIFGLETLLPLTKGSRVIMGTREAQLNPAVSALALMREAVTILQLTPSMLSLSMTNEDFAHGLKYLKCLLVGGEAFPDELLKKLREIRAGKIYNVYGPTETTIWSTLKDVSKGNSLNIGTPIANTGIFILDKNKKLQPIGICGELFISGEGMARGYINNPQSTAEKFILCPFNHLLQTVGNHLMYHTGDVARWLPDGNIEFFGRIDNQIKIRGFRVELGEIERRLSLHESINEAVVICKTTDNGDKHLYSYIVYNGLGEEKITGADLRRYLARTLPDYMIPSYFVPLETLPLTPNGKVDREALPNPEPNVGTREYVAPRNPVENTLAGIWSEILGVPGERIGVHDNYFDLGGTSFEIIRINGKLREVFQLDIPVVNMYRYTTIKTLAQYLNNEEGNIPDRTDAFERAKNDRGNVLNSRKPVRRESEKVEVETLRGEHERMNSGLKIAVIGMAGRFPGARDTHEFWDKIKTGMETITFFSDEELRASGIDTRLMEDPNYIKAGGKLEDIEHFDASFFSYTTREAEIMNPQIRVFHETVWTALEDAGYNPETYKGLIGLYAGAASSPDWEARALLSGKSGEMGEFAAYQLMNKDFICQRIAYKLNLRGPSYVVQTACSTSLVAIHVAYLAILNAECDLALGGGVTISSQGKQGYMYQEGMIASPDGHCRAFDSRSKGTVGGEGAGVVVLKRLDDAIDDRDHIYAVIKGSAINNDGIRKAGFSAASVEGQAEVVKMALKMSEVQPESIGYIETHGTGTSMGDSVEIEALRLAFDTGKRSFCGIGSVKSNVGHLDTASGVTGFIKTVLALNHRFIPPSLHFEIPNPGLDLINSQFYVVKEPTPWVNENGSPLRAGVSSFGLGGTNAHIVLEEAPPSAQNEPDPGENEQPRPRLLILSARTQTALAEMKENLARHFNANPSIDLTDAAYTLQTGRKVFKCRWMAVCANLEEAINALTSPGGEKMHTVSGEEELAGNGKIKQTPGMMAKGTGKDSDMGPDRDSLTRTAGLWLHGRDIDWEEFYSLPDSRRPHRVSLPSYPFERQRYWIDADSLNNGNGKPLDILNKDISNKKENRSNVYVPLWKPSVIPTSRSVKKTNQSRWLMFIDESVFTSRLMTQLKGEGEAIRCVRAGNEFIKRDDFTYTVDPQNAGHYDRLLDELQLHTLGNLPVTIVHLWSITGEIQGELDWERLSRTQAMGFYSLLYLVQAIERQDPVAGKRLKIKIVTDNMQNTPGQTGLYPGKATVLSLVKTIPREFPNINCHSIDICLPRPGSWEETKLRDRLLLELRQESSRREVAYRGNDRLVKSFEPIPSVETDRVPPQLKKDGVYLVTGEPGPAGFDIAQYLALKLQPKLIFIRDPYPAREITKTDPAEDMGFLSKVEEKIEKKLNIKGIDSYEGLEQKLNQVCSIAVLDYFKTNSIDIKAGNTYDIGDLKRRLRILKVFDKFFDFFIRMLSEDKFIKFIKVNGNHRLEFLETVNNVKDFPGLVNEVREKYPQFEGTVKLVTYCQSHYGKALSGDMDSNEVLFPGGKYIKLENDYRNPLKYTRAPVYIQLIQEFMVRLIKNADGRKTFRILEIGGGQGVMTNELIPHLRGREVEYHFTDLGNFFVTNARKQAARQGFDFMKFSILDISRDPVQQGCERAGYDLVLAYGVVHMVPSIEKTLGYLEQLLVPGGAICLVEHSGTKRWDDMINGLAKGWWYFEDTDIRKDSPLLSLNSWEKVFKKQGFQGVSVFPRDVEKQAATDCGLIIARRGEESEFQPGTPVKREEMPRVRHLEKTAADVHVVDAGIANLEEFRQTVAQIQDRHGKICGVVHCDETFKNNGSPRESHLERADRVLAGKLKNIRVLSDVFKDISLDFLIYCSSRDPLNPAVDRIGDDAVNMFLNSLAHYQSSRDGRFVVSITQDTEGEINIGSVMSPILEQSFPQVALSTRDLENSMEQPNDSHRWDRQSQETIPSSGPKLQRPELENHYEAPGNRIEEALVNIWEDFLGIEPVGISDNFFDLGTDSLVFITIATKIHKTLEVNIPIAEFFNHPTIRELARYIVKDARKETYSAIEPVEEKEYYALSSPQRRIYFLQQIDTKNASYNIPFTTMLEGDLDRHRFRDTFRRLTGRHENLRTSFEFLGEEVVQRVHQQVDLSYEYHEAGEEEIREVVARFIRPFDLSRCPLFRVGLIKIARQTTPQANSFILMLDIHHIIADGASLAILIKEFMSLYGGSDPAPLKIQYKDFANWHRGLSGTGRIREQEQYWLKVFSGDIPAIDIPTDYPRPVARSFEGERIRFTVEKDGSDALKAIAVKEKATIFIVLLALFNVLLAKISGQEDLVVGTPTAGRRHSDMDNIMGMFVNTLVLRNSLVETMTFKQFLSEVKAVTFDAFENQDYQFEDLVEKVVLNRDVSRNPMFEVMFILQNYKGGSADIPGIDISGVIQKPWPLDWKSVNFDLTLTAYEKEDRLDFQFEYRVELFKKETMSRITQYFKKIVNSAAKNPDRLLSEIEIIDDVEKQQLLVTFNDTKKKYPIDKTIHRLFEEQVERRPDQVAVVFKDDGLTYGELNLFSNKLACILESKGVAPDIIVGIMADRSLEMFIGIYGILKAGGAYLPIDPDYPEERINYILSDSGAGVLVRTGTLEEKFKTETTTIFVNSLEYPSNSTYHNQHLNLSTSTPSTPANLAYVIYTSGSTGKPKGVMVCHSSAVNVLSALHHMYPSRETDVYLLKTPVVFDVSVSELFGWFWGGGRLAILEPGGEKDPTTISKVIARQGVTHINFVPSMFNIFVDLLASEGKDQLSPLKYIFLAGEALLSGLVEKFRRIKDNMNKDILLENIYGPTETTVYASRYSLSHWAGEHSIPIGKPLQNTHLYILDKEVRLQPIGVPGELCISGAGVTRGYLNQPELTADKFLDWVSPQRTQRDDNNNKPSESSTLSAPSAVQAVIYRTGDLARWLPDGNVEFLGRLDRQVKIRGFRIELGEIEKRLERYDNVKETIVVAREDQNSDKYLCAYVIPVQGDVVPVAGEVIIDSLREYLSAVLPAYMVPAYFVTLRRVPLTATGKVDLKALPDPDPTAATREYTAPRNRVETTLADMWADLLIMEKGLIGVDDNFFKLGGHSLRATIMVSKIHKVLNVKLPLTEVFRSSTIRQLAQYILTAAPERYAAIEPVEKREYYGLSAAQKRLYIIHRMDLESTAYNMPQFILLEKAPSLGKLEEIFMRLIHRHESLRTSFHMIDSRSVQRVHDHVEFTIELKAVNFEQPTLRSFVRPFDLSRVPLLRIGLATNGQGKTLLMVDMHHIISDGISNQVLVRDCNALLNGEDIPPLRLQYKDFSEWQNSEERKKNQEKQEQYWLDLFSGEIPVLNLPTDYPRPVQRSYKGSVASVVLGPEQVNGLKKVVKGENVTMYILLLAVYNIFLWNISNQEEIVIGTTSAGRNHPDLEKIIGVFINTLALRNQPKRDHTFGRFIQEVKKNTLKALANQDCQFDLLVEKVGKNVKEGHHPIFDVRFTFNHIEPVRETTLPLETKPIAYDIDTAKFDLTLNAEERGDRVFLFFEYSTDLFKEETIKRYLDDIRDIISILVKEGSIKLRDIAITHDFIPAKSKANEFDLQF